MSIYWDKERLVELMLFQQDLMLMAFAQQLTKMYSFLKSILKHKASNKKKAKSSQNQQ